MAQNKKNHSELSIRIRKISLAEEPDVRYFLAELDGQIVGYYTNTERYDLPENLLPGRFNIMNYITYEAIKKFREENVKFISLGLSHLYDVENSPDNDNPELTSLFSQMYEENELYAFKGIAQNTMKKNRKINIRISENDLSALQRKSVREGIPYQTLIASVLHKFASGFLKEVS